MPGNTPRVTHPVLHTLLHTLCYTLHTLFHALLHTLLHTPLQVPEYQAKIGDATKDKSHWKPKHHFTQHIPIDILYLGPARGYWCFSYEGFNKVIKKITKGSNFKNICKRVADVW